MHWVSRDWGDGKGYSVRVHYVPDGHEQLDVPRSTVYTFEEHLEEDGIDDICECMDDIDRSGKHKYRYALRVPAGIKVFQRTNPNNKWDSWRVGGRYASKFQVFNQHAAVSSEPTWEWREDKRPEGYDVAQFKNLNFDGMKKEACLRRAQWISSCMENCGLDWTSFEAGVKEFEVAKKAWRDLPEPKPRGEEFMQWLEQSGYPLAAKARHKNWELPEIGSMSLQEFIDAAPAVTGFALLDVEGVWHQEGDMGMFGCVLNEDSNWGERFQKLFHTIDQSTGLLLSTATVSHAWQGCSNARSFSINLP